MTSVTNELNELANTDQLSTKGIREKKSRDHAHWAARSRKLQEQIEKELKELE